MHSDSLFSPQSLQTLCRRYALRPSKKYGQNFLIDETVIDDIIAAAELKKEDVVMEVGPGFGTLTLALAPRVKKVMAFEIEKKLEPYWKEIRNKKQETNDIEIVWGNILKKFPTVILNGAEHSEESLSQSPNGQRSFASLRMTGGYKVIANLPYQITSPVIRLFLEAEHPPEMMVLTVQKEVAERICAPPGEMSLLSVAVQYYAEAEIVRVVPRASFWPEPKVDSAVIRLITRDLSLPSPLPRRGGGDSFSPPQRREREERFRLFNQQFFRLVKTGFAQRRKLLIKNLEPIFDKINKARLLEILSELGLSPTARAQELSVEQWRVLVRKVESP